MASRRRRVTRPLRWPAGRSFVRAHSHEFGSTEFDTRTDVERRFSPLTLDRKLTPVIYAGSDDRTAAAETIFHWLPDRGRPRRVWLDRYRAWHWSRVRAARDLQLLPLDARTPGVEILVDGDASTYPDARDAAAELLREHPAVDGLIWASRQLHDRPSAVEVDVDADGMCLLLLGRAAGRAGGVDRGELTADEPVVPFATPEGVERLDVIGHQLDVTVTRS